jgi:hypothetical protein
VQEWAAPGLLDALDLGLTLGMALSEAADRRRDEIRAIVDEIDREPPGGRRTPSQPTVP